MLIAWGDIGLDESFSEPTVIEQAELVWSGWAGYIVRGEHAPQRCADADRRGLHARGTIVAPDDAFSGDIVEVIGFDRPAGVLLRDGLVRALDGSSSVARWEQVVVTGLGSVYASDGTS